MADRSRILLTGAAGFVGAEVAAALLSRAGVQVIAALQPDFDPWRLARLQEQIETVPLDLTDKTSISGAVDAARPTHVIHCAAYGVQSRDRDSRLAFEINVEGTVRLHAAAARAGVSRFVYTGSCSEYGHQEGCIHEGQAAAPVEIYGATKAAAGILIRERGRALGLETVHLRLFNIWGPREASYRLVPLILDACGRREPLDLSPGDQVRDYSFVGDMAEWIVRVALMAAPAAHDLVNLGSGRGMAVRELVLAFARLLDGVELMRFGARAMRPDEPPTAIADTGRMEELLDPVERTSLEPGLQRMMDAGPPPNPNSSPTQ